MPDPNDLLALIDAFYETALDDDGWDRALAQLAAAFDGNAAVFLVQDRDSHELDSAQLWGRPGDAMEEYQRDFVAHDVGVDDMLERGAGSTVTEEQLPDEIRKANPFLNEFRRKWQIERYLAGGAFADDRRVSLLAVQGEQRRRPFSEAEAAALQRLLPHVRRAIQLRQHVGIQAPPRDPFEDAIEHVATGVILIDRSAQVRFANAAARRMLERADGIRVSHGRLGAMRSGEERKLSRAVAAALAVHEREGTDASDTVTISRTTNPNPYAALVIPIRRGGGGRQVAVLIGDPDARVEAAPALVARLYGLTPAESSLAISLASGDTLEDYAELNGIALSTSRWRLKQVQAKTGARRQVDLVRLLLNGPAALAALRED